MTIIDGVVYDVGKGTRRFSWLCRRTNKVYQNAFMKRVRKAAPGEPNTGFRLGRLNHHV